MDLGEARHLLPKETAVLIRQALAVLWPRRKFKVRTHVYAGGASVYVSWPFVSEEDDREVTRVARQFDGRGFCGMTDSAFYVYRWLAPGPRASLAYYPATFNAPADERPTPCADAELVCFGVSVSAGSTDRPPRRETEVARGVDDGLPF